MITAILILMLMLAVYTMRVHWEARLTLKACHSTMEYVKELAARVDKVQDATIEFGEATQDALDLVIAKVESDGNSMVESKE